MTTTPIGQADETLVARGRVPFAMMPKALVRGSGLSAQAVRLWAVLDSYAYHNGAVAAVPSRAQLAADCDWKSPRSVDVYLRELEQAGWLTTERRRRSDGGKATNRYVLEWIRRAGADVAPTTPGTDDAESEIAGQPHAQESAHGSVGRLDRTVGDSVIAGQPHAQDPAHGSLLEPTHAQGSAHAHAHGPAHPRGTRRSAQEDNHHQHAASPTRLTVRPGVVVAGEGGADLVPSEVAASRALADAVRAGLPATLAAAIAPGALRRRCETLVNAGWSAESVWVVITSRSWNGSGPGAVIAHLDALAQDGPPVAVSRQARPPWCGICDDERTRLVARDDGRVGRCPRCHPLALSGSHQRAG